MVSLSIAVGQDMMAAMAQYQIMIEPNQASSFIKGSPLQGPPQKQPSISMEDCRPTFPSVLLYPH